jgi:2-succinyl-5-enolpyruvyl-6-hydroxy-3-cyclohexene-1-carboxylate synthase
VLGDLSFLYDVGSLLWTAGRSNGSLVFVVISNGGGEIFSLLPQRELPEHRALFVTPHHVDLGAVSAAAGVGHTSVDRAAALPDALGAAHEAGGIQVVEVVVDADQGLGLRAGLKTRIAEALSR